MSSELPVTQVTTVMQTNFSAVGNLKPVVRYIWQHFLKDILDSKTVFNSYHYNDEADKPLVSMESKRRVISISHRLVLSAYIIHS